MLSTKVITIKTTILASIESKDSAAYYTSHKKLKTAMASDAVIISPNVEVIRDRNNDLLNDSRVVSVITSAAPNLRFISDMLDLKWWDFYVYPTFKIDNNIDDRISDQKTISVRRLQKIGVEKCSFSELYKKITDCLEEVSAYYKG